MSCLFPQAPNLSAYWTNIVNGVDSTRPATDEEWDPEKFYNPEPTSFEQIYCKRGGFITELADFDPLRFGVMPNSIQGADPDQLLALRVASEALADAGYDSSRHGINNFEVILGRTSAPGSGSMNLIQRGQTISQVLDVLKSLHPEYSQEQLLVIEDSLKASLNQCNSDTIPAVMPNVLAGRIAGRLGFKGRSMILDAACASSLVAVEIAMRDLISGQTDLAVAGGLHVNSSAFFYQMFCGLGALSKQQIIRPFDDNADGTILGEGLGMVVLKRLSDAKRDGNKIYAIISGIGSSSDGLGTSMLAPSADGEALAIERAYEMAGVSPRSIELLEAHGTGTPSGDVVEMQAIQKVFGTADTSWIALGSVKSMIGHCQAASGIAGLIKTALALYHRILPPSLNVQVPNTLVDWQKSSCYVNTESRTWIHPKVHPQALSATATGSANTVRRAAVSAFGFGGVNSHAVLEEYDDADEADSPILIREWTSELCLFTAENQAQLIDKLRRVEQFLQREPGIPLRDVAFSLSRTLKDLADTAIQRIAIVAYSVSDLRFKLDRAIAALESNEEELSIADVYFKSNLKDSSGKLAFVLPGLGAAYPNMLTELCYNFPDVRAVFDYVDHLAKSTKADLLPSKRYSPALKKHRPRLPLHWQRWIQQS